MLQTVRDFKSLGVGVYFEEQNIHTMRADGELMLTILSGYAQEESLSAQLRQYVAENASQIVVQTAYLTRYSNLATEYESLQAQYEKLQTQKEKRQIQAEVLNSFLSEISKPGILPLSFSDALWHATVDHVTVHADGRLVFCFKNDAGVPTLSLMPL